MNYPDAHFITDEKENRRQLCAVLSRINRGKVNCTKAVTLSPSLTATTLTDERIGYGSFIDFMPTTASAATAKASIYITNQVNGSCTINHAANTAIDQTFVVAILA